MLAIVGAIGLVAIVILGAAHSEMTGKRSRRRASSKSPSNIDPTARAGKGVRTRLLAETGEVQDELLPKNLVIPPPDEARIEAVAPRNERPRRF